MKRIQGFVVGYDKVANELLWTVKVKDQDSQHNGQKFLVASLHPGTMLTRPGVDVTFRVRSFGTEQEQVLRAIDVSIGKTFPDRKTIVERIPDALALAFVDGKVTTVVHTECESVSEAQQWIVELGGEEVVVGLVRITPELIIQHGGAFADEDAVAGLATLRQMMYLDPIRDTVCAVAAEAFELGRASRNCN
ncbi:hypothetical protein ACFL08_01170 [Patescibacteria group bacterium]